MINEINTEGKKYGLEINYNKSTFMASRTQTNIKLNDNKSYIEYNPTITYLGQIISFKDKMNKEISTRRINLEWNKYWSLKFVLKNENIDLIFQNKNLQTMLYSSPVYIWVLRLGH